MICFRRWWTHDDSCIYMLFDYVCGGELFSYLRNAGRFSNSIGNFISYICFITYPCQNRVTSMKFCKLKYKKSIAKTWLKWSNDPFNKIAWKLKFDDCAASRWLRKYVYFLCGVLLWLIQWRHIIRFVPTLFHYGA